MPIITVENENSLTSYALWEITEELDFLLSKSGERAELLEEFQHIKSEQLKLEKAATRLCLQALLQSLALQYEGIYRDHFRKPHLKSLTGSISFSHCFPYVGVSYHANAPTGIDIQDIRPKISRIAPKFMTDSELQFTDADARACTIIWCIKEALYKIHGRKEVIFKEQLSVDPFDFKLSEGRVTAYFKDKDDLQSYKMMFRSIKDYIITYNLT